MSYPLFPSMWSHFWGQMTSRSVHAGEGTGGWGGRQVLPVLCSRLFHFFFSLQSASFCSLFVFLVIFIFVDSLGTMGLVETGRQRGQMGVTLLQSHVGH